MIRNVVSRMITMFCWALWHLIPATVFESFEILLQNLFGIQRYLSNHKRGFSHNLTTGVQERGAA